MKLTTLALFVLAANVAHAEPVVTIHNNGPDRNRINMIVLGDGYTAGEMVKYISDANILIQGVFAQTPFSEYERYFNIHLVYVVSNESGADHPERGVFRDTALGAAYNCHGVQRMICADGTAVNQVLSRSFDSVERDLVVVLVNDQEYGGVGGSFVVGSTHRLVVEIVLHEAGHTLGLLADEYDTDGTCNNTIEPRQPNVTRETTREAIKWNYWIEPDTSLPTTRQLPAVPGLYEGASYCRSGLYRPTFNSKMRSSSRPFEQVNIEQLVKRFYNFVSPIDLVFPDATSLTLRQGQPLGFAVEQPSPSNRSLRVVWTIDGRVAGTGASFTVDTGSMAVGSYIVEVVVRDDTLLVRSDPREALVERFKWSVTIVQ